MTINDLVESETIESDDTLGAGSNSREHVAYVNEK